MKKYNPGFTLIEMLMVVAVLAILALMALPSYQGKLVRDQVVEGSTLAKLAKDPIAAQWSATRALPVDNAGIALPAADKTTTMGENKTSSSKENLPQNCR